MKKDTIWGILIGGAITFAVGYIFFDIGNKKREPVYSIINSPSLIFDKSNSSPKIKLLINDSIPITKNVYVTTLAIWNKGRLPINKEDIRRDLFILLSDSLSHILDYKILDETESDIGNFQLIPVSNKLKINWDFFDSGFGFKVQIIYSGTNETQLIVTGRVMDSNIKFIKFARARQDIIGYVISFIIFIGIYTIGLVSSWKRYFANGRTKDLWGDAMKSTFYLILFLIFTCYLYFSNLFAISPFWNQK